MENITESLYEFKINVFLVITKYMSILSVYLFEIFMKTLMIIPDNYYCFITSDINIDYESDSDSDDSDDNQDNIKNILPLDTKYCIELNQKLLVNDNINKNSDYIIKNGKIFDNSYILSTLNKIKLSKSYHVIYAELLYLYTDNTNIIYTKKEITKKIKIIQYINNGINVNIINYYYNNPNYLFVIYYCFNSNMTKYKIFDLKKNKDITSNKSIMFGHIKL